MKIPALLETFLGDVRVATRGLLKSPGFVAVVVLSLALGIAANSTIYSVLNAVLYRPLPYPASDRLVAIWQIDPAHPDDRQAPPIAENVDWRNQNHVFDDIALTSWRDTASVAGVGEPRMLRTQYVSANFFSLLGAKPIVGRMFAPEEAQDASQTVLISDEFWKREFNGDPNVLGKTLNIEGVVSTIVGVMQPGFAPFYGGRIDIWQNINPASGRYVARFDHWLMPVARLKQGVTIAQAQTEMQILAKRMEQEHPNTNKGIGAAVFPLHDELYRWAGPALYPLLGAVAFVLLIACVNVANLMQFRTETRRKEFALRVSLGAGRWRLIRQLLTESGLLALAGGVLGGALTLAGIKLFLSLAGDFPDAENIQLNGRVLLFTLGLSLATAFLVGLLPAIRASRMDLNTALREGERRTTSSGSLLARHALAVSEMALAVILLAGAGLMINTVLHLQRVNPGFDVGNLLTLQLQLPEGGKYLRRVPGGDMENTLPTVTSFYQRLLEKTAALPGVESAAVIGALPTRCCAENYSFAIVGKPTPEEKDRPFASYSEVSANALSTLKVPLIRGRFLDNHDNESGPWVIVVNDAFVHKYFPNEDPIGRQIQLRYDPYPVDETRPRQIVGVVGNVHHFGLGQDSPPFIYAPFEQQPPVFPGGAARAHLHKALVLRTHAGQLQSGANLIQSVKNAIAEIDPDQPVTSVMTMDEVLSASLGDYRAYMQLLGIFASVAVLLAAIGIYGVMSYSVNERTHEFGVRLALGAQQRDILALVGNQMLKLTCIAIAIGVAIAMGLMRLISTFLFGVKPTDPLTYVAVAVFLAMIAALACYLPARRAIKVDPLVALRYE
jgi:putative ABC transport system permease protein